MDTIHESTVTINNDDERAKIANDLIKKMSLWRLELRGDDLLPASVVSGLKIKIEHAGRFKALFGYKGSLITLTMRDAVLLDILLNGG